MEQCYLVSDIIRGAAPGKMRCCLKMHEIAPFLRSNSNRTNSSPVGEVEDFASTQRSDKLEFEYRDVFWGKWRKMLQKPISYDNLFLFLDFQ